MNHFTPGDTFTFLASPSDPEHTRQTATVIATGPGTLTGRLSDGTTVGLAIDRTVRRVEQPHESAENGAETGQIQTKPAKTIKDTPEGQRAAKIESYAPERIYLQWHGDGEPDGTPVDAGAVTWCADRIHKNDVLYVRADLALRESEPQL